MCVSSATFVKMRDAFHGDGRDAQVGSYAFGFAWGSWTALLIATVLFFASTRSRRSRDADVAVAAATPRRRFAWPWRRGAAVEGRRVKDEYA